MIPVTALDDTVVFGWLASAYGDVEASRGMRFPLELRVELYPEVLRWGPNGLRVATLFDAARNSMFKGVRFKDLLRGVWGAGVVVSV